MHLHSFNSDTLLSSAGKSTEFISDYQNILQEPFKMHDQSISEISVHELKNIRDQQPDICLIDVRELHEWQLAHIPGAKHIPKGILCDSIASLVSKKDEPLYLYCQGGVRSLQAANTLKDLGYTKLHSVKGGLMEWSMFGYPVES